VAITLGTFFARSAPAIPNLFSSHRFLRNLASPAAVFRTLSAVPERGGACFGMVAA
jgi:hypothetical protein